MRDLFFAGVVARTLRRVPPLPAITCAPLPESAAAAPVGADVHGVDESHERRLIEPAVSKRPKSGSKVEAPLEIVIPGKFRLKKPANWVVLVTLAIEFVQMAWFPLQVLRWDAWHVFE